MDYYYTANTEKAKMKNFELWCWWKAFEKSMNENIKKNPDVFRKTNTRESTWGIR